MAITSKEHKTGSFFIKNNFEGESWVNYEILCEKGDIVKVENIDFVFRIVPVNNKLVINGKVGAGK